jgi:hypothetical protein
LAIGHSFDVGDGLNYQSKVITTTNVSTIPNIKPSCQEEVDAVPWASVSARPAGTVSTHTPLASIIQTCWQGGFQRGDFPDLFPFLYP